MNHSLQIHFNDGSVIQIQDHCANKEKEIEELKEQIKRMKDEIIYKLEAIQKDLEEYLNEWKKRGGGTRGYAIGSMIKRIKELREFFKNNC